MKSARHLLFAVLPLVVVAGLGRAGASGSAPPVGPRTKDALDDSATRQAQLKRAFQTFRGKLALLATRLDGGSYLDRQRAKSLRKALAFMTERGTEGRFDVLIRALSKEDGDDLDTLQAVVRDNKELRLDLQRILKLLVEGDPARAREKKVADLTGLLDRLRQARDRQARLQAQTERGRSGDELAPKQDRVTEETREVLKPAKAEESASEGKMRETIRKPVEAAVAAQGRAGERLHDGEGDAAAESQGEAVTRLDEAIGLLEGELGQERHEERQQRLADLLSRSKRMLAAQVEVRDAAVALDRDARRAGRPAVAHGARANRLADKESLILFDVEAVRKLIKEEATAVAFAEVFEGVSDDVEAVRDRLARTDVGGVTQGVAGDVIDTLREIVAALEKAIRDDPANPPPPPPGGHPGPRPTPPLVNLLQQMKMVRGMQKRIHARTAAYGRRINGEQLPEVPAGATAAERRGHEAVHRELRSLAQRQKRLTQVTREVGRQVAERGVRID